MVAQDGGQRGAITLVQRLQDVLVIDDGLVPMRSQLAGDGQQAEPHLDQLVDPIEHVIAGSSDEGAMKGTIGSQIGLLVATTVMLAQLGAQLGDVGDSTMINLGAGPLGGMRLDGAEQGKETLGFLLSDARDDCALAG